MSLASARAPTPVFFAHYGEDGIRGSERVLLDLFAHLDRDRFAPLLWCNQEGMASAARALGVETRVTPMPILAGWSAPRFELAEHWRLRREARECLARRGIRMVHANSGAPNQWLVPASRRMRIGYLTHLHAHYVLRDRCTMLLHRAQAIAGCSAGVLEPFAHDGVERERLHTIPNGVDVERIAVGDATRLRAELGIAPSRVVVTAAGALIPLKGFDVLIRAMQLLTARGVPASLLIAGAGPEERALRRMADHCGVAAHVHWLGQRNDLGAILRDATDIVAVPSRQEAFGLTVAEGAVFGVPAVASDIPGLRETVTTGHLGGLLAPAGDVSELADAIETLARDTDARRAMGVAARTYARQHFTVQVMVERLEALYSQLAATTRAPTPASSRGSSLQPWRRLGAQWMQNRLRGAVESRQA